MRLTYPSWFRVVSVAGLACFMSSVQAEETKVANTYPTQARVEYVFGCMNKYGGENYNTMYGCVCAIDEIASRIPYDNYVNTQTLALVLKVPGERSAQYRDMKGGREAVNEFNKFSEDRESYCGLKKPVVKPVAIAPAALPTASTTQTAQSQSTQ